MRPACLAPLFLFVAACANILGTHDSDAGAANASDGGADGAPQVQGAYCGTEQTTGATLCAAISTCPNVIIDRDLYPNCGYRITGTTLDMQCACDGQLCPMGTPATCAQASSLLRAQSESQICAQVNEGRCITLKARGGTGGTGGTGAGCNPQCAAECGNVPNCRRLCGC